MFVIEDQNVLVLGLGLSGVAATELLLKRGAHVTALDSADSKSLREQAMKLRARGVTVDLGVPDLNRSSLPMDGPAGPAIEARVKAAGREIVGTAVSVGNPHFVVFVDGDPEKYPVEQVGPALETHSLFPERVNAEFVQVLGPHEARQRTWERGSGETLACGTGAAAVCVAGVVTGRLKSPVTIHLRGGDLLLEWEGKGKPVLKTGPTVEVFRGEYAWPQPVDAS